MTVLVGEISLAFNCNFAALSQYRPTLLGDQIAIDIDAKITPAGVLDAVRCFNTKKALGNIF